MTKIKLRILPEKTLGRRVGSMIDFSKDSKMEVVNLVNMKTRKGITIQKEIAINKEMMVINRRTILSPKTITNREIIIMKENEKSNN